MAQLSLFLVVLLALVIPIFMARFKISTVPTAIAEIIVGIIVGSSGFNIVVSTHDLTFLSNLGVILLMFLSGMELILTCYSARIILRLNHRREKLSIRCQQL